MTRVLIVGGYGLVGGWVARHLRAAGHDVDLVLGGRSPEAGRELAGEVGAELVRFDLDDAAGSLAAAGEVDLVISMMQDPHDDLLVAALRAGTAHLGIVRKMDNVGPTALLAAALARKPALLLGHWQAGATTYAALTAAREFERVDTIELAALFDPADAVGAMTSNDRGAFFVPGLARREGRWEHLAVEAANRRSVSRAGLPAFEAQPMGVLDVAGLAAVTGAPNVRFDLGEGTSRGTASGDRASHEIYADLTGLGTDGAAHRVRTTVSDPFGQAHLTAAGVVIGTERLLGLSGEEPLAAGLHLPERVVDAEHAVSRLRDFGVTVEREPRA
ncbi:NmrA family NAD(P)-binding protein [Amycolatopsis rhabdoformis]|uniref:NmrA family NAD(P)-binding protein n=1 Tax=Amycolatopsis rhabdoformis TaxID=1448059 RepID=A0ABZ1IAQ5_9PSEU|nr:NmrA family NAD(P)-binding protein [Amycolatopsis rhabdoformis]WSE31282.1 NmrA family NAD(P)-binding protein [Amycolatopsis rhabdoformis]